MKPQREPISENERQLWLLQERIENVNKEIKFYHSVGADEKAWEILLALEPHRNEMYRLTKVVDEEWKEKLNSYKIK